MVKRLVGKELIEQSLLELLESRPIEGITVTEIAKNCGITTRTFYYYFADKHDVVSSIYLRYMEPYMNCSIKEWYEHMAEFFMQYHNFMEHCLTYSGQNSLSETIIDLEWKKLKRHFKPEVYANPIEFKRTEIAIEYMLHGNVGSLRNSYVHKRHSAQRNYFYEVYGNIWNFMSDLIPQRILQNLSMEPVKNQ